MLFRSTSTDGCVDSTSTQVQVHPLPLVNFITPSECEGDVVTFVNLTTGATSYAWSTNNFLFSNAVNPTGTFTWGQHPIKLIGTNQWGCQDSAFQFLEIYPRPVPSFDGAYRGCVPLTVTLHNTSTISNGLIANYTWSIVTGKQIGRAHV